MSRSHPPNGPLKPARHSEEERFLRVKTTPHQRRIGEALDETCGVGPPGTLMRDPTLSDILVDGPGCVHVERLILGGTRAAEARR